MSCFLKFLVNPHLQHSPYNLLQPTQSVISVPCFPRPRQCLSALWVINVNTELFSDTLHLKQLNTIIPGEGQTKKVYVCWCTSKALYFGMTWNIAWTCISAQLLPYEIIMAFLDLGRCVLDAGPRQWPSGSGNSCQRNTEPTLKILYVICTDSTFKFVLVQVLKSLSLSMTRETDIEHFSKTFNPILHDIKNIKYLNEPIIIL